MATALIFDGPLLRVDDFCRAKVELFTGANAYEAAVAGLAVKELVQVLSEDGGRVWESGHARRVCGLQG